MKWISSVYTYSPSSSDLPTPASHLTPLGHPRALSWAPTCYTEDSQQLPILYMGVCVHAVCSVVAAASDSLWPRGLQSTRLLHPWDPPGKNTGEGFHAPLHGIFLTQGSNTHLLHLPHHRHILYCWATGEVHIYHICTFPAFCSPSKTMIVLISKQWRSSNYTQISENEVRNSRAIPSSPYVLGESVHRASQFSRLEEQFSNVSISVTFTLYCYCSSVFGKWSPSWQKPCCIPVSPVSHRVPNS